MNVSLIFDLIVGFGAAFLRAQNKSDEADILVKLGEAKQSGANVDAALQRVAEHLNSDAPLDWQALNAQIDQAVTEFTGLDPAAPEPG